LRYRAVWVKICANTNLEDARLAAELGADAVGFVFAPSKRQVTSDQVAAIVPHLPARLEKIGVFTSRDAALIADYVRETGLTGVQLHGGFDLGLIQRLRVELGDNAAVIQTLHWVVGGVDGNVKEIREQLRALERQSAVDRILVDSKMGDTSGGSGVRFDWSAAHSVFVDSRYPVIVAGGLDPANVGEAIAAMAPWGVDVASGVETAPGRKDPQKLLRFMESAFVI
jgi:phosphoribosylanthranilate isomerase